MSSQSKGQVRAGVAAHKQLMNGKDHQERLSVKSVHGPSMSRGHDHGSNTTHTKPLGLTLGRPVQRANQENHRRLSVSPSVNISCCCHDNRRVFKGIAGPLRNVYETADDQDFIYFSTQSISSCHISKPVCFDIYWEKKVVEQQSVPRYLIFILRPENSKMYPPTPIYPHV